MTNASKKRAVQPSTADESNRAGTSAQPPRPPNPDDQLRDDRLRDARIDLDEPTQSSGPTSLGANRPPASPHGSDLYAREPGPPEDDRSTRGLADEYQSSRNKLTSFVEQYRNRQISKSKALASIAGVVDDGTAFSESEKDKTIRLYLEELDSIHRDSGVDFVSELRRKRSRNQTDFDQISVTKSVGGSQRAESEEGEEPLLKKKKLTATDLGWPEPNAESPNGPLPLSCQLTLEKLDAYSQDITRCKFLIRSSRIAPSGIPSAQWERIFRGETLDLNHFLSSLHRTTVDEEGETRIGNAKISFGVSDAKRRVTTAGDWNSAWNLASSAVAFAFPHRAEELRVYGDYISGEFSAKLPESHSKVILFDISIRNLVQGGQSFLLTDHQRFLHIHSAILLSDGVETASKRGGVSARRPAAPRASGSRTDICNRYNSPNGCPSTDSDCRYKHICKSCKKVGHGKDQCPK